ncbi:M16 family metallopeptidase [Cellulophaga tyrosinoxydans]|uniref:Predicted Zn-dependent peptidase n=1 Tax=Cellulophaga tyrosinoxydans TaxID=504486 RepID=A0A1W2BM03_9FLAO|nr:pitrilysin family protein [Cellulophaga tyrosinoxydans]SMC73813.1 Predicted Zn-dependent peptidase [Cellulophaga tyrosinoxydans]
MKKILLTVLTMHMASMLFSQSKAEDVKSFMLKNGMKVMVLEDHSIPNANMYLFWKVGSRNEYPGITGLSHFFEHMMFNGSKKYGPKMFDRTMEAAGGSNNAYTTENVTVYTDWFPSSSLETIFDLEADRIANLALDSTMVESERGVVLSERSTGLENSNFRNISEEVKASAFSAHPYRWSVIGYESDIKNWSIDDLQRYFDTYYAPNNAVVVISGDVTLAGVKKLASQYFEPIPAQPAPRKIHTVEPEQRGEKRVMVQKQVSTPNVLIAYHVPETQHEDHYALDVLNSVLSSGKSSKLYSYLVDENQYATSVFSYMPESFDPNLFYIYGIAGQDVDAVKLENEILNVIDGVIENGITEKELQKVKNQKLMEFYKTLETIDGKSDTLGTYELYFGDYKKMYFAPEAYEKVTTEDIKRVAKKYFTKNNRTVGVLQNSEPALGEESK